MIGFILSGGRSGSNGLHMYLKPSRDNLVFHEPAWGTQSLRDAVSQGMCEKWPIPKGAVLEWCRGEAIQMALDAGKGYIEATPVLSPLVEVMPDVYPDAKVLWLYRDPKMWLRSAMHIGFCCCVPRDCWHYWMIHVHLIMDYWDKFPAENKAILKTTEIHEMAPKIWDWMECGERTPQIDEWMSTPKTGHQYNGPKWYPHPDDWTKEQNDEYKRICGDLPQKFERLYQEWSFKDRIG